MKGYVAFIGIALGMSFVAGYLTLSLRHEQPDIPKTGSGVQELIGNFSKTHKPISRINLFAVMGEENGRSLLDPANALPRYHLFPYGEIQKFVRLSGDCRALLGAENIKNPELQKALIWERAVCARRVSDLPDTFFSRAPFFHPSGQTYAFLRKGTPDWNNAHAHYFHISEAQELAKAGLLRMPETFETLRSSEIDELNALAGGEHVIISPDYVHIRVSDEKAAENRYAVYDRQIWDDFWKRQTFRPLRAESSASCYQKYSGVCWTRNIELEFRTLRRPVFILLALSAFLTLMLTILAFRKLREEKMAEQAKRFALQVLTHELRTPLASLSLSVENLRGAVGRLEGSEQETLLRMFDDVERLKRLAEMSKQYLSSDAGPRLMNVRSRRVESVFGFVESTLDSYRERIDLNFTGADGPFSLDPFWAGLCIRNLTENALQHGVSPVKVFIEIKGGRLHVCVEDAGFQIFNPEEKGKASAGLGVGLHLVRNVLSKINGNLRIQMQPTRFNIDLGELS